jgi:aminoglycoside phosphotransferase (APT) family kinase protein
MTTDISALVDAERLKRYLAGHVADGPGADAPFAVRKHEAGYSNETFFIDWGATHLVMRRPPRGDLLPTSHDVAREHRALSGLWGTAARVPRPRAFCDDATVIGAPFYVMDRVHGVVLQDALPEGFAPSADDHRRMSEAHVDTLAALHAVDYEAVGLGDFGHPQGYMARQVRRWGEQWERSKTRELPDIDALKTRLEAAVPASPAPTIVHGDYRLGNVMFDAHDPGRLAAVLDWEMSTLGDPLSDVGYMIMYWGEQGDGPERQNAFAGAMVSAAPGFYTREQLVARYAERSGRAIGEVEFYLIFAFYKLAIIVEGIQARFLAGQTYGEGFEDFDARIRTLAQLGLETAARSSNPALRGGAGPLSPGPFPPARGERGASL